MCWASALQLTIQKVRRSGYSHATYACRGSGVDHPRKDSTHSRTQTFSRVLRSTSPILSEVEPCRGSNSIPDPVVRQWTLTIFAGRTLTAKHQFCIGVYTFGSSCRNTAGASECYNGIAKVDGAAWLPQNMVKIVWNRRAAFDVGIPSAMQYREGIFSFQNYKRIRCSGYS